MSFLETYLENFGVKGRKNLRSMIEDGTLAQIKLPEKPDQTAAYLSRVALELVKAITLAAERHLGYFGDIANRLFPSLPLPERLTEGNLPQVKDYVELVTKLDALNSRAVVMEWSHLREVPAWVTAGGTLKLEPIWTLAITRYIEQHSSNLNRGESILTQLTTDSVMAQKLLNALTAFKNASRGIRSWYTDVVEILFQENQAEGVGA